MLKALVLYLCRNLPQELGLALPSHVCSHSMPGRLGWVLVVEMRSVHSRRKPRARAPLPLGIAVLPRASIQVLFPSQRWGVAGILRDGRQLKLDVVLVRSANGLAVRVTAITA